MRLGSGTLTPSLDLASAVRTAADALGHRPAVTVLRPERREEQGFASLMKWTSKGAHLLSIERSIAAGDQVTVRAPAGWPVLTVCLAAWWLGATALVDGDVAATAVVHERSEPSPGAEVVYRLGDAADGSPLGLGDDEPWAVAVQTFPDRPPAPGAAPDRFAVLGDGFSFRQSELLTAAGTWGHRGPLGLSAHAPPRLWLPALVRPFVAGAPTVVVDGAPPEAARGEGVAIWADS